MFWSLTLLSFVLFVFVFKGVLLPFVMGITVAYLLNPMVNKLGTMGIKRGHASLMILSGFLVLLAGFIGSVAPILYRELVIFADDLPEYIEKLMAILQPLTLLIENYASDVDKGDIENLLKDNAGTATNVVALVVGKLAAGGQTFVDIITVALFMPIVAYFMMKEWPYVTGWVNDLIPRHARGVVMGLLKQINEKLSGFVRGQVSVAIILGVSYALALTIAGLKYGLLIGLMSGLLSVIPMVGSAVGLIVSIGVAWFQMGDYMFVLLIAGIFIAGQIIEGNFLTPKLVGDSVGLHPLWVFFALLAGGSILGILGMFLAVPVAAVIGVLLSFGLHKYKKSAYYSQTSTSSVAKGDSGKKPSPKPRKPNKKTSSKTNK